MSAMAVTVTLDDQLCRQIDEAVARGNRSALFLDRPNIAAAAAWHASLTGDDAAVLAAFDAEW